MAKLGTSLRIGLAASVLAGSLTVALSAPATAAVPTPTGTLTVAPVGTYDGGGNAAAEIVAFDAATNRAFISNGLTRAIDIVDFSTQSTPTLITSVSITSYGSDITSVATKGGVVAAALSNAPTGVESNTPQAGSVLLLDTSGTVLKQLTVGVLPDAITFSRDGRTIVVAGEAEPICSTTSPSSSAAAQDPLGTVSIIDLSNGAADATVSILDFSSFDKTDLLAENVRVFFPNSTAAQDLEPEYPTISADGTRAYVTLQENNALTIVDLVNHQILDVVSLGYKDHSLANNALDASDRDGPSNGKATNITTWPLLGMYQPDAISAFDTPSGEYLATANEGDARSYSCFNEEARISALNYTGSSISSSLRANAQLGRLNSTTAFPTASPITQLYSYGARSFSIWSTSGTLVWDSGDEIERWIAATYPTQHNGENGVLSEYDSRSDNKGAEPEGIVVGKVGGRSIAFVGLERAGGVVTYDVTDPTAPTFNSYVNPLFIGSGPGSTDKGPEGLTFVGACEMSDGVPVVLVANEISGTTTMYRVTGGGPEECSVSPTRVFDTRPGFSGARSVTQMKVGPGADLRVKLTDLPGKVPASGVGAVRLNLAVTETSGPGFVTVYPCGTRPTASSLNFTTGQTIANAVISQVSAEGEVCFHSSVPVHLVADLNGWYATGSTFTSVTPARVVDTRPGGTSLRDVSRFKIGPSNIAQVKFTDLSGVVPASGVSAVSMNVAVTETDGPGFVTVYPCATRPTASSLNFTTGQTIANAVISQVSEAGEVCFYSSVDTHVVVDVNGWFATGSKLTPVNPARVVDTRPSEPDGLRSSPKLMVGPASPLRVKVADLTGVVRASDVAGVSLNVTVTETSGPGFVTVYPCGTRPTASSLNFTTGQTIPNAVISQVSGAGEVCFYSSVPTHLIVDLNGWIAP
jgi:hypothetical protein